MPFSSLQYNKCFASLDDQKHYFSRSKPIVKKSSPRLVVLQLPAVVVGVDGLA